MRNHVVAYPVPAIPTLLPATPGYLPTTSIGTVMVFGGMHAFWSQA